MLGRKGAAVEKPKIYLLIPDTLLNNGEVGTVLRAGDRESPIAQRQVIAGMEWHRCFYTEYYGSAAERGEIVGFIRNRRDPDGWRLFRKEPIESLRIPFDVTDARET